MRKVLTLKVKAVRFDPDAEIVIKSYVPLDKIRFGLPGKRYRRGGRS